MSVRIPYTDVGFKSITRQKVDASLNEVLGQKVSVDPVKGSSLNLCYRVKGKGIDAFLKISPLWYNQSLRREMWCYRRLYRSGKLGLSRILLYLGKDNRFFQGHELLLLEYIGGRPLTRKDFADRMINRKVGQIFNTIHNLNASGYGFLSQKFKGRYREWRDFLNSIENIDSVVRTGLLSAKDITWLKGELRRIKVADRHCLLYGDFNPPNFILREDGKIVPLDFQSCFAGKALYDLGSGLYNIPHLLDHLSFYCKDTDEVKSAIVIYAMRRAVTVMSHRSTINDRKNASQAKKRFDELRRDYLALRPATTTLFGP